MKLANNANESIEEQMINIETNSKRGESIFMRNIYIYSVPRTEKTIARTFQTTIAGCTPCYII